MNKENKIKWILASASPRRKEILAGLLPDFDIIPSGAEENVGDDDPARLVEKLAGIKCSDVVNSLRSGKALQDYSDYDLCAVIAADTLVFCGGEHFGKPVDREDCERMLRAYSGRSHEVLTGVCVMAFNPKNGMFGATDIFSAETMIFVDNMSEEEVEAYASLTEPYDKAGGYGIQGKFAKHINAITGDYLNVVGFPLNMFYKRMKKLGLL